MKRMEAFEIMTNVLLEILEKEFPSMFGRFENQKNFKKHYLKLAEVQGLNFAWESFIGNISDRIDKILNVEKHLDNKIKFRGGRSLLRSLRYFFTEESKETYSEEDFKRYIFNWIYEEYSNNDFIDVDTSKNDIRYYCVTNDVINNFNDHGLYSAWIWNKEFFNMPGGLKLVDICEKKQKLQYILNTNPKKSNIKNIETINQFNIIQSRLFVARILNNLLFSDNLSMILQNPKSIAETINSVVETTKSLENYHYDLAEELCD